MLARSSIPHVEMKDPDLARVIGSVIRSTRLECNFSQAELSQRCGVNRAYLACVERGEKAVTVETVQRIARALGIGLAEFFKRVDDASSSEV